MYSSVVIRKCLLYNTEVSYRQRFHCTEYVVIFWSMTVQVLGLTPGSPGAAGELVLEPEDMGELPLSESSKEMEESGRAVCGPQSTQLSQE